MRPFSPPVNTLLSDIAMDEIIERSSTSRVSLLKMDIEGADAVGSTDSWLPKVDAIAIELHDDS